MYEDVKTFPTWRHHATLEPRIFKTREELEAAGPGWLDSPDRFLGIDDPVPEEVREELPPQDGEPSIEYLREQAHSIGVRGNIAAMKYDTLARKIDQIEVKPQEAKGEDEL